MRQRPDDGIQNLIEALPNIFAQKPQHMISVLLEQNILAPITLWITRGEIQDISTTSSNDETCNTNVRPL